LTVFGRALSESAAVSHSQFQELAPPFNCHVSEVSPLTTVPESVSADGMPAKTNETAVEITEQALQQVSRSFY